MPLPPSWPRPSRLLASLIATAAAAGCGGSSSGRTGGSGGRTQSGSGGTDGGLVADAGLSHCPVGGNLRGPDLVRVRWNDGVAFCIDGTEVTNSQYAAFLAAGAPATGAPARCAWNQTRTPETQSTNGPACPAFDPIARPDHPVVCVDWCDADAYCRWAGKHLCRKPDGNPVTSPAMKDGSEWVLACTGDTDNAYPYGAAAEPGRCVDRQFPAATAALHPVKEAAQCEGGFPGLFDMSGNAAEWQDDCVVPSSTTGTGEMDSCDPLGGSFSTDLAMTTCTSAAPFFRRQVAGDTGFRCCVAAQFF